MSSFKFIARRRDMSITGYETLPSWPRSYRMRWRPYSESESATTLDLGTSRNQVRQIPNSRGSSLKPSERGDAGVQIRKRRSKRRLAGVGGKGTMRVRCAASENCSIVNGHDAPSAPLMQISTLRSRPGAPMKAHNDSSTADGVCVTSKLSADIGPIDQTPTDSA